MRVLVLNSGSTSQKTSLYEVDAASASCGTELPAEPLWADNADVDDESRLREEVIRSQLARMWNAAGREPLSVVGHRIVHGGRRFRESVIITDEVKVEIRKLCELAPLHNPAGLDGLLAVEKLLPNVPQVAVFDTSLHSRMPPPATIYPLPYTWYTDRGIQRFGFHGINHSYCFQRVAHLSGIARDRLRLVSCHLGGGCSLAAIQGGFSVDTTMGYTPLEGLMMATRCGSVDPGILIHMLKQGGLTVDELDNALNRDSGLEGISGISGDMKELLSALKAGDERAQLAIDMYVHRLRSSIAAMAASMNGLDALAFTGGVGENSAFIREQTCAGLEFLGVRLDSASNESSRADALISARDSSVQIFVIKANENWTIAHEAALLVQSTGTSVKP